MSSISSGTTTTTGYVVSSDTTGALVLKTGSAATTAVTIDTSQNVGIGVTPSAWRANGGDRALQVGPRNSLFSDTGLSAELGNNVYLGSSGFTYVASATASRYRQYLGAHEWFSAASGTAGSAISFTQRMTLDTDGNLLVGGTTSPSGKAGNFVNLAAGGGFWTKSGGVSYFGTLDNYAMILATNDTERARIDSSGNVQIGNSGGSGKLNLFVSSSATLQSALIATNNANADFQIRIKNDETWIGPSTATPLIFANSSNTERMRIDSSGNVGIGTSAPNAPLDVRGNTGTSVSAVMRIRGTNTTARTTRLQFEDYAGTVADGLIDFKIPTAGSAASALFQLGINGPTITMDVNSKVGIGNTAPTGNLHIGNGSTVGDQDLYLQSDSSNRPRLRLWGGTANKLEISVGGTADINVVSGLPLVFSTNNTERARFTADGDFLVGSTNVSTSAGAGVKVLKAWDGAGNDRLAIIFTSSTSSAAPITLYSTNASQFRFYVDGAGTINATNTTITAISDVRLKENIRDLDDGLEKIMALQPRKFDWKKGKGKDIKGDRGWIAQEFEQVFPDMIGTWLDEPPEGEDHYKSVRADLIPTLVKAIQEQQLLIQQLQADVAILKGGQQ